MAVKLTDVWTYIGIIFVVVLFVGALRYLGNEAALNPNANLDNDSADYIASMGGINLTEYRATQSDMQSLILSNNNFSQGNPKDYSIDFQFAKEKGSGIESTIRTVFNAPSMVVCTVMRMPCGDFKFVLDAIGWLLSLGITIALINYARKGTPDQ